MTIAFSGAICAISVRTSCFWFGIEPVGRLVEHQHRRIVQQRLREPDAALEAFGQGLDRLQPHAFERGQRDRVLDAPRQLARRA